MVEAAKRARDCQNTLCCMVVLAQVLDRFMPFTSEKPLWCARGSEGVRKEVAAYIEKRDGYPSSPDVGLNDLATLIHL